MNANKLASQALDNALPLAIGAAVIVGVVYYLGRKTISDSADAVGGIVSGNNAVTRGTVYEGTGTLGTIGAATDAVSGGVLSAVGEKISSWFTPTQTGADLYFRTIFPDASVGAVPSNSIDAQGYFTYKGGRYRMGFNASGYRVAVRV